ncbi:MAG: type II secretion system major pseudopilin GspG [Bacillota bacterium]|nr:type II secretion system major pseudopilin GspG [Bacillota bacterium]
MSIGFKWRRRRAAGGASRRVRRLRRAAAGEEGFTLLEMLIVIAIIGILAVLVGPNLFGRIEEARQTAARSQISTLKVALDLYRLDNGLYPTTDQGLAALRTPPTIPPLPSNWRGPYLEGEVPKDPWGRDYVYRSPGEHNQDRYDLMSYGRDGKPGGEGPDRDIVNW